MRNKTSTHTRWLRNYNDNYSCQSSHLRRLAPVPFLAEPLSLVIPVAEINTHKHTGQSLKCLTNTSYLIPLFQFHLGRESSNKANGFSISTTKEEDFLFW